MYIESKIENVLENPFTKSQFVILKEKNGKRKLTINIGLFEATQLENCLDGTTSPRPMPLDLFSSLLFSINYQVSGVYIEKNFDKMYFAKLKIIEKKGEKFILIDSRPSDALSIALKEHAPVFINSSLLSN